MLNWLSSSNKPPLIGILCLILDDVYDVALEFLKQCKMQDPQQTSHDHSGVTFLINIRLRMSLLVFYATLLVVLHKQLFQRCNVYEILPIHKDFVLNAIKNVLQKLDKDIEVCRLKTYCIEKNIFLCSKANTTACTHRFHTFFISIHDIVFDVVLYIKHKTYQ